MGWAGEAGRFYCWWRCWSCSDRGGALFELARLVDPLAALSGSALVLSSRP
jgi:hypothetical protein